MFLSPLRGSDASRFPPTAYAVGCILSPLRGWRGEESSLDFSFHLFASYQRERVRGYYAHSEEHTGCDENNHYS